jgi:cysteine desulfurase
VAGIVGFGVACEIAGAEMASEGERLRRLRERLTAGILARVEGVRVNGSLERRVAGNLNLSFEGVDGEALLMAMRDVALSSGSACASASAKPSHVLLALGIGEDLAHASLRFGLGRGNTQEEVDAVIDLLEEKVRSLRAMGGGVRRVASQ